MQVLKRKWKKLISDDMDAAFQELESALVSSCSHFNSLLILKGNHLKNKENITRRVIQPDQADIVFNSISQGLLEIVDGIEKSDLKPEFLKDSIHPSEGRIALHDYHKFTCDRVDQSDQFHQLVTINRTKKVNFFSILGIELQSHAGIFNRFAFDVEGKLLDYLNPNLKSECQSLKISLTFEISNDVTIYKQNILKSLFASFGIEPNENGPILEKNLTFLYDQSPLTTNLGPEDFVCIFLNISHYDWDAKITPLVTRWLITEFCKVELPAHCPTFQFFFGLVMDEYDEEIQTEIREAINRSEFIAKLPELGMVQPKDLGKWLNKYQFVLPHSRDRRDKIKEIFGTESEKYMEDIEIELQRIIDTYNNGL